jgi:hypothetical protein
MISPLIGGSLVLQTQAYSDEGFRRKRGGKERKLAMTAGMQAARQLLEV